MSQYKVTFQLSEQELEILTNALYSYAKSGLDMDSAWTFNRISKNPGYEIDTTLYSVENTRTFETSNHYIYNIKENE